MITSIDRLPIGDYKFNKGFGVQYVHVTQHSISINNEVISPEEIHEISCWEESYPTEYIPI